MTTSTGATAMLPALVAAAVGGREAHVLHALATGTPTEVCASARHFGEDEWASILDGLRERQLVTPGGTLTESGLALKRSVEDQTDALAWAAYSSLAQTEVDDLMQALRPITSAVGAAGEIPTRSPMGLDLDEPVRNGPSRRSAP